MKLVCGAGATCEASACVCGPGLSLCNGQCVDTSSNPNDCGFCNNVCAVGAACQASACACNPGLEICGAQCVNPLADPNNCGVCGKVCGAGLACVSGTCAASLYFPSGPEANVPVGALSGWKICYQDTYSVLLGSVIGTVEANCNEAHILMACGPNGAANYTLLAAGLRSDVFTETGAANNNTVHVANGVGWYFDPDWSWGFVPAGDTPTKNQCDTATSPDDALRLCWHTVPFGGYRCGATVNLNSDSSISRYVFQAP